MLGSTAQPEKAGPRSPEGLHRPAPGEEGPEARAKWLVVCVKGHTLPGFCTTPSGECDGCVSGRSLRSLLGFYLLSGGTL